MTTKPRIVVLDGYTANPGDLTWSGLAALGELEVHDRTSGSILERARDATVLLTNKVPITAADLAHLPELRFVSVLATGTNVVDLRAARERGVVVSNVPSYSTPSVAQHVFALLLEVTNRAAAHAAASRDLRWSRGLDFSFTLAPIPELCGRVLGIIGFGSIGRAVAQIGVAFGMRILVVDRPSTHKDVAFPVERAPLEDVFKHSDVLTLHCPLTEETRDLVNEARLRTMKPTAILINTGRGDLVDELALANALEKGTLSAAGLDVLRREPPAEDNPLLALSNCVITPHLAWASVQARERLIDTSVENVAAFMKGNPQNVVN